MPGSSQAEVDAYTTRPSSDLLRDRHESGRGSAAPEARAFFVLAEVALGPSDRCDRWGRLAASASPLL
jgi:hypothetical protein